MPMDKIIFGGVSPLVLDWHGDWTLERGRRYLVEAASGRGKSSLLSFLYGYRRDYRGIVAFDGRDIRELSTGQWGCLRRESLAIVFQGLRLFPELTAWENVMLKNNLTRFQTPTRVRELFCELGLEERISAPAGRLSFGEQQRVAFIRMLCQRADFYLLDEPTSHLDSANSQTMARLLDQAATAQGAGVVVTSIGRTLPFTFSDRLTL